MVGTEQYAASGIEGATVKAVVLTGAGSAFCAGGNVKHMRSHEGFVAGNAVEIADRYRRSLQQIALALHELEVPLITAVNGPAMEAGLDIACMCDVRIASEQARFAETFVRLGIISGVGGSWFLPRVVGAATAAELSFTGRVIDAEAARRSGNQLAGVGYSIASLLPCLAVTWAWGLRRDRPAADPSAMSPAGPA